MEYFLEQKEFIESLDEDDSAILASYTKYGDELINGILRNKWNKNTLFEFISSKNPEEFDIVFKTIFTKRLTKENCLSEVKAYIEKFKEIFKRVPPVKKAIRVFRGLHANDSFDPRRNGIKSPTVDFLSTTYAPYESSLNHFTGEACCIMEFIIQPGVRALWIQGLSYFDHEMEILIENNIALYNGCRKMKMLMHNTDNNDISHRDVEVFEFEIKPYRSAFQYAKNVTRRVLSKLCYLRGTTRSRSRSRSRNRFKDS
jgi:hypothetical protein